MSWEHKVLEVGGIRDTGAGAGGLHHGRGGTENHRDPSKSLLQGDDVVPLHLRKVTTATLWGLVGKVGGGTESLVRRMV